MPPKNTDSQRKKKRDTLFSACLYSVLLAVSAIVLLYLRRCYAPEGLAGAVLLISSVLDLGMIVPVWILARERKKEIEGGEEDAAAQY